ncbi:MAG: hypothetical protein M1832_005822 [Thelocarpon impressellum]|nr:MAG: hypothetical protein M1832_005822 [Thelocarpon impressellum]
MREDPSGYGMYGEPPQFATPAVPGGSMQYQAGYAQEPHKQEELPQYRPNIMYNMPQQAHPGEPYGTAQQHQYEQPRQSGPVDALSSQFAGTSQFFVQSEPGITQGIALPSQQAPSPFIHVAYHQQGSAGPAHEAQRYQSGMPGPSQETTPNPATGHQFAQPAPSYDDEYEQYRTALKRTFENTRNGQLVEAGQSLLWISEWLLSHAVDLGLVVDDQELHGDRIKLWNEFNQCWLAALQRQKDMTQSVLETGRPLEPPQSLIQEDFLERMGTQLVRLCDNMERHGLVDYQMGVWEEEIVSSG